jgi:hypothetical protein
MCVLSDLVHLLKIEHCIVRVLRLFASKVSSLHVRLSRYTLFSRKSLHHSLFVSWLSGGCVHCVEKVSCMIAIVYILALFSVFPSQR